MKLLIFVGFLIAATRGRTFDCTGANSCEGQTHTLASNYTTIRCDGQHSCKNAVFYWTGDASQNALTIHCIQREGCTRAKFYLKTNRGNIQLFCTQIYACTYARFYATFLGPPNEANGAFSLVSDGHFATGHAFIYLIGAGSDTHTFTCQSHWACGYLDVRGETAPNSKVTIDCQNFQNICTHTLMFCASNQCTCTIGSTGFTGSCESITTGPITTIINPNPVIVLNPTNPTGSPTSVPTEKRTTATANPTTTTTTKTSTTTSQTTTMKPETTTVKPIQTTEATKVTDVTTVSKVTEQTSTKKSLSSTSGNPSVSSTSNIQETRSSSASQSSTIAMALDVEKPSGQNAAGSASASNENTSGIGSESVAVIAVVAVLVVLLCVGAAILYVKREAITIRYFGHD